MARQGCSDKLGLAVVDGADEFDAATSPLMTGAHVSAALYRCPRNQRGTSPQRRRLRLPPCRSLIQGPTTAPFGTHREHHSSPGLCSINVQIPENILLSRWAHHREDTVISIGRTPGVDGAYSWRHESPRGRGGSSELKRAKRVGFGGAGCREPGARDAFGRGECSAHSSSDRRELR